MSSQADSAAVPGWLTVPAWLQAALGASLYPVHTCSSHTGREPSRLAAANQIKPSSADTQVPCSLATSQHLR